GRGERPRGQARGRRGERHGQARALQDRAAVGAEAEERRAGERGIAGEAADDVPRERQHPGRRGLGAEAQQVVVAEHGQRGDDGDAEDDRQPALHSYPFRPMMPVGRKIRSSTSSTNATVSPCSGPRNTAAKLWITPSASPPIMAPMTVPSPPSTQATNASPRNSPLLSGEIGKIRLRRLPA